MVAADAVRVFVKLWHLLALGAFALASFLALAVLLLGGLVNRPVSTNQDSDGVPVSAAEGAVISAQMKTTFAVGNKTARAEVRRAVRAINAYGADHNGSYKGATVDRLRLDYDGRIAPGIAIIFTTGSFYCLQENFNGFYASYTGPSFGRKIVGGTCY